jgi:hypothetical protein
MKKNKINIYPNPANENITIEYHEFEKDFIVELFDFSGKLIDSKIMNSRILTMNLTNYSKGFYTLMKPIRLVLQDKL